MANSSALIPDLSAVEFDEIGPERIHHYYNAGGVPLEDQLTGYLLHG
jgi:hypothetical protein